MTTAEAGRIVAYLNAAFPRDALEPESAAIWVAEVSELGHAEAGLDAARTIGRNGDRFPSLKEYRQAYRAAFDRWMAGRELEPVYEVVGPPDEFTEMLTRAMCRSIDDLPVTDAMTPRPVWARHLRRQRGADLVPSDGLIRPGAPTMHPPTDAEKHDAMLVILNAPTPDKPTWDFCSWPLLTEAQRIMDECS